MVIKFVSATNDVTFDETRDATVRPMPGDIIALRQSDFVVLRQPGLYERQAPLGGSVQWQLSTKVQSLACGRNARHALVSAASRG